MSEIAVERMDDVSVRVRTDRPGERATSAVVDGKALIAEIALALGLSVHFGDDEGGAVTLHPIGDTESEPIETPVQPEPENDPEG